MRGRFARRAAGFVGLVVLFLVVLTAAVSWLLTTLFGGGWVSIVLLVFVLLVAAAVVRQVVRSVRLTVAPMGDLIEASARVEAGEFGTLVPERGPREVRTLARAFNAMSTRLADTDRERRRLIADVSHELRTPLTVIQGNVEGMIDGLYPADGAHLERVLAETRQLERLINDLRTLSLADAGALGLQREPTHLADVAADAAAALEPRAVEAGVALSVDAHVDLPTLELDPLRIRQVVTNLVTNALRHTSPGGRITVQVSADGDGQLLSVSDTGVGMTAETAARAFDRFWRTPDSSGAGLGLAIVRDLVTAHGGSVELRSEPGRGTTVTCRFER